jgi:ABC-type multidrug transport system fused ATPase/permease subunit
LVAQKAQEQLGDANSVAQEALGAMTTVRAFAGESEELDRYHKQLLVYYDTNLKRCFAYRYVRHWR